MKSWLPPAVLVTLGISLLAQADTPAAAWAHMSVAASNGDKATYADFLSADLTWINRAGRLRNKAAVVDELTVPAGTQTIDSAPRLYTYGAAAVMTLDSINGTNAAVVQAWTRTGNRWQLVAFQTFDAATVAPSPKPSTDLPPASGSAADRDGVQKNFEAVARANITGDANMFAAAVTDQFVSVGHNRGGFKTKAERLKEIKSEGRQAGVGSVPDIRGALRIHGNLAVATIRLGGGESAGRRPDVWQTVVHVREGREWRRAAVITTPMTGAAAATTR